MSKPITQESLDNIAALAEAARDGDYKATEKLNDVAHAEVILQLVELARRAMIADYGTPALLALINEALGCPWMKGSPLTAVPLLNDIKNMRADLKSTRATIRIMDQGKAHRDARIAELESAQKAGTTPNEIALRRLLAYRVAGAALYGDDGQLQDTSTEPWIDFKNDPVDVIEVKLVERTRREIQ